MSFHPGLGALPYEAYVTQRAFIDIGRGVTSFLGCLGKGAARGAGTGAVIGGIRGGTAGILPGAGWSAMGGTINAMLYTCEQ